MPEENAGRLSVVGAGIRYAGQLTTETRNLIQNADQVFALVTDGFTLKWLAELNPRLTSLQHHYRVGRQRDESYRAMVDEVLASVRNGLRTCAIFYGHPGVYVWPSHEMIRRAHDEGYVAKMFPAISAEDCLIADLDVDPAASGWQSYEAMDFLLYGRQIDPSAALVLWQVGALGDHRRRSFVSQRHWVQSLVDRLQRWYPSGHEVVLYEAAAFPLDETRMEIVMLEVLADATLNPITTLYLPPATAPELDRERLSHLGIEESELALGEYQRSRIKG